MCKIGQQKKSVNWTDLHKNQFKVARTITFLVYMDVSEHCEMTYRKESPLKLQRSR